MFILSLPLESAAFTQTEASAILELYVLCIGPYHLWKIIAQHKRLNTASLLYA